MGKLKEDVREAVTGSTPDNDLRARLHADHNEVAKLLAELWSTTEADVAERTDVRNQVEAGLASHTKAEEEVIYRRIQMDSRMREQTEHGFREHGNVDTALDILMNTDPADPAFSAAVKDLRQVVSHHVHDEENELLPQAEQLLGREQLATLIPTFNDRKRALMKHYESEQRTRAVLAGDDA